MGPLGKPGPHGDILSLKMAKTSDLGLQVYVRLCKCTPVCVMLT